MLGLALFRWLLSNQEYEFYCDSVAMDKLGANIFSSALKKVFFLNLAHNKVFGEMKKTKLKIVSELKTTETHTLLGNLLKDNDSK